MRRHIRARPARRPLVTTAALMLWGAAGCYHYRLTPPQPDPVTEYQSRTVHSLFWGLLQQNTRATNCLANAIDEVRVTTNLGYTVATVATLGIWAPLRLEWRCSKPQTPPGVIRPAAPTSSAETRHEPER